MTSAAEPAGDSQLGGRLPLLTPAELDPEQASCGSTWPRPGRRRPPA